MKKEFIKCEAFTSVSDELLEMVKNALLLGFNVECNKYATTYMVSIYK